MALPEIEELGADGEDLTSAKTATEWRRARLMEIELQARQGELISKADADKRDFALARTVRNRVLGIAPRIAAEVFGAKSVADVQRIVDRERRLALECLAEELEHGRP
jgi:hypothetical protein